MLLVKLLHHDARLPERMSDGASGYDVFAIEDTELEPGKFYAIRTGIALEVQQPETKYTPRQGAIVFEIQLRARSSLSSKGVTMANGVGTIDADYRGEILVPLIYLALKGAKKLTIKKGDRIAQLVICAISRPDTALASELSATARNDGGFGSTN